MCAAAVSDVESARRTFFFAFPLYEVWRTRQLMLSFPGAEPNKLLHRTSLSQPSDRSITTPNNDTLYSTAWLDLASGPVRFSIPAMHARYHSIELMDVFSDAFAILRNEGSEPRAFLIVGPGWNGQAAEGEVLVRAPTRDVWLVSRTFVQGPDDLLEAQIVQKGYRLDMIGGGRSNPNRTSPIPIRPDTSQFLSAVNTVLARGTIPEIHKGRLSCFATAGIAPGQTIEGVAPTMRRIWDQNLDIFYSEARNAFEQAGTLRNGWRYPAANLAEFGTDDVYRSAIAMSGLAALPTREAINPVAAIDENGLPLNGDLRYRLRIPGKVPVDAFWSLTLYESDGAGRWFLYNNSIHRYVISSASNHLEKDADGTIVIEISHQKPVHEANWLPAPKGRFVLVFRAYRPNAFVNSKFLLPPVEIAD